MSDLLIVSADPSWPHRYLPTILPNGWREVQRGEDGAAYLGPGRFSVIISGQVEADGRRWLHLSCAKPDSLPTWQELRWVKETFLGPDRYALQVFPPRDRWVNIHPFCLHLFACVDTHPLPEFSGVIGGVRTL